jgi:hypothetical protein
MSKRELPEAQEDQRSEALRTIPDVARYVERLGGGSGMWKRVGQRIELLSNVSIVVVSLVIGFAVVKNYLWPGRSISEPSSVGDSNRNGASAAEIIGRKLDLPDVEWAKNERNLVLVLQSKCPFCTESAPFYKELVAAQSRLTNTEITAVFPESDDDAKAYLGSIGLAIDNVRRVPLRSIGVQGTPTVLLVNSSGVVTGVWRGRLNHDREEELWARLQ